MMTRSYKDNDRNHVGLADGSASAEDHLPRYFAKHGPTGIDPKKVKKEGAGKANWGRDGDEMQDYDYNLANHRRRSNSSTHHSLADFKTKFEAVDADPVFEESIHGYIAPPEDAVAPASLDKEMSFGSISGDSFEEEEDVRRIDK